MKRRQKRSLDCDEDYNECDDCDCNECMDEECDGCSTCCGSTPIHSCNTRSCCHETCHSKCKTSSCRRNCRKTCNKRVTAVERGGLIRQYSNSSSDIRHNITTVINLNNVINNTNIIDIPINVNNTNLNNITVESSAPSEYHRYDSFSSESHEGNNCCKVIGPRQCVPIPMYPFAKCYHYRKKVCGDMCQTSIMHAEPHQVCDQENDCHQQISYIPQPQPRCSYTSAWPYVQCNVPQPNCEGCYSHTVSGGNPPKSCSANCYQNSGYNVDPMYRHGPYYQPDIMQNTGYQMESMNPMENMMQIELNSEKNSKKRSHKTHESDKSIETVDETPTAALSRKE
ncbi:PREDICTED: uncharacterized protein LOC108567815 [Nicrophorus vespilloides]|uniref:Uncharacterized protein LOC108567815 n=1 Tax=Nicrophorus vespilloides TaxID=110193 RepID=A0ABM1NAZ7_NICVS|nr:PREDICTED: uncharacterized protein LOC108567815 [Nicrophorus vespilloides]